MKKRIFLIVAIALSLLAALVLPACDKLGPDCGPFTYENAVETIGGMRYVKVAERAGSLERAFTGYIIFNQSGINDDSDGLEFTVYEYAGMYPDNKEITILQVPMVFISGEVGDAGLYVSEKMTVEYMGYKYEAHVTVRGGVKERGSSRCSPVPTDERFDLNMEVNFTLPAAGKEGEPREMKFSISDNRAY